MHTCKAGFDVGFVWNRMDEDGIKVEEQDQMVLWSSPSSLLSILSSFNYFLSVVSWFFPKTSSVRWYNPSSTTINHQHHYSKEKPLLLLVWFSFQSLTFPFRHSLISLSNIMLMHWWCRWWCQTVPSSVDIKEKRLLSKNSMIVLSLSILLSATNG